MGRQFGPSLALARPLDAIWTQSEQEVGISRESWKYSFASNTTWKKFNVHSGHPSVDYLGIQLPSVAITLASRSYHALSPLLHRACQSALCFSIYSSNFIGSFPVYFLVTATAASYIELGYTSSDLLCISALSAKYLTSGGGKPLAT